MNSSNDFLEALLTRTTKGGHDAGELARLEAGLAQRAAEGGIDDVVVRTLDTPVGQLLLAATPVGLVRVAFAREGFDAVEDELARALSPRVLRSPARLDAAARQLDEYFTGTRHVFELPLDRALSHGFRRVVHEYLPRVAYGAKVSYGELANAVGNPKAVRAVGTACATNPLPIVVPCHRVVRSDGSVGQYLGGAESKQLLLNLESSR